MLITAGVILAGLAAILVHEGDLMAGTADLGADGSIAIEARLVSEGAMRTTRRLIVAGESGRRVERDLANHPDPVSGQRNSSTNLYWLSSHLYAVVSAADCFIVETTRPSIEACPRARTETSHDLRCVFRVEYPNWGLVPDPLQRPEYLGRFDWLNGFNDEGVWTLEFRYQGWQDAREDGTCRHW